MNNLYGFFSQQWKRSIVKLFLVLCQTSIKFKFHSIPHGLFNNSAWESGIEMKNWEKHVSISQCPFSFVMFENQIKFIFEIYFFFFVFAFLFFIFKRAPTNIYFMVVSKMRSAYYATHIATYAILFRRIFERSQKPNIFLFFLRPNYFFLKLFSIFSEVLSLNLCNRTHLIKF